MLENMETEKEGDKQSQGKNLGVAEPRLKQRASPGLPACSPRPPAPLASGKSNTVQVLR